MKNKASRVGRLPSLVVVVVTVLGTTVAWSQLVDRTQSPNTAGVGIALSLEQQIGDGRGAVTTPNTSLYFVSRDPARAIRRGRQLFQRKFTFAQGVGPRKGDGNGDIDTENGIGAGLSDSCASCHGRPRGAAGFGGDVATRPDSRDSPHLFGLGLQEMLADEITAELRQTRERALARARSRGRVTRFRLRSKGIRYGVIEAHPDGTIVTNDVRGVDPDLRVRPFFAEGSTISIREFVVGAMKAEMGLESADPDLCAVTDSASPTRVVTPAGMVLDPALDKFERPPVCSPTEDGDGDGVVNELDPALVDFMEFYLMNYFKPALDRQTRTTRLGFAAMKRAGCTGCHVRNLSIARDRRVADVETVYDPERGVFNRLFATASTQFSQAPPDGVEPARLVANGAPFVVENIFTDFKRHDLGPSFWERNYDGTIQKEFMTEPLWGVGTTPPYGHDGRSSTLRNVILRHGGEATAASRRFARMSQREQDAVIAALQSLVLFPPDDTASNLDPGDPTAPMFPQFGHGSIALSNLFTTPGPE